MILSLDRFAAAALATANEIRFKLGLPAQPALVPGIPRNRCECPLARTIAGDVDDLKAAVNKFAAHVGDNRYTLDDDTSAFIDIFDLTPHNSYPELIAPEGRFANVRDSF